jgi:hypothetical protein
LQCVYPKPELIELSEYLIPNGAWLKLPCRFKKPFQFLFQTLHPTLLRASLENLYYTNGRREPSCASNSAMGCSVGSFTSPAIGQLGQSISADGRNSGPLVSKYSSANRFIPVLA